MARILLIEDNDHVRKMLQMTLQREGHDVLEAYDGLGTMAHLQQEPFDLVITDIDMPGKNGHQVIEEIRQESPNTKIIAITGGSFPESEGNLGRATQLGPHRTFHKPIPRAELLHAIRELTQESPGTGEPGSDGAAS